MIDRAQWAFVSGEVNSLRERLLDERAALSLLQAGSLEERNARLRTSLLFSDAPPGPRPFDEVEGRFEALVNRIAGHAPDPRVGELFLIGPRWQTHRATARARFIRKTASGTAENADFDAALRSEVTSTGMGPLVDAARRLTSEIPREGDLAGWIDRLMDPYEARASVQVAQALDSEMLLGWVRDTMTQRGALAILRARVNEWDAALFLSEWRAAGFDHPALTDLAHGDAALWPAAWRQLGLPNAAEALGRPGAVVRLDKMIDDRLSAAVSAARGLPFGPEVVFAFLWALRMEAINLRLALAAAEAGIPERRISAEMRNVHV